MVEKPRISVNELARFMVVSETARHGIIKRAREPNKSNLQHYGYREVREHLCSYLIDPNSDTLEHARGMFLQRTVAGETPFQRDDARQSVDVIDAIQEMKDRLEPYQFSTAPPSPGQEKLVIHGVEVSLRVDVCVHSTAKTAEKIGAAVLRMAKDEQTLAAQSKRKQMGLYVATLIMMHMKDVQDQAPAAKLCLSIDVRRGEVFAAPPAHKKRVNDLRSACQTIAALWEKL